jgi:molybdate transport system substrate-binding protein
MDMVLLPAGLRTLASASAAAAVVVIAACGRTDTGDSAIRLKPDPTAAARRVRIAAASDIRYALDDMAGRLRQAVPGLEVEVVYGSSGTLFAQLTNGAPFDLFLSADVEYPTQLSARGLTLAGTEFRYADGRLAVWAPASSPIDVENRGMDALVDPAVAHVAIANPAHAPYGRAAEAAMRQARVYDRVKSKIVFGENVSQALQFVQSGAAEIGVVALSLALAPALRTSGKYWTVPPELHPPLEQGGVIMKAAADPEAARAVRTFMLGAEGRTILGAYGFSVPGN